MISTASTSSSQEVAGSPSEAPAEGLAVNPSNASSEAGPQPHGSAQLDSAQSKLHGERKFKVKVLRPFLRVPWISKREGPLEMSGCPYSGELKVQGKSFTRVLRVDGESLCLIDEGSTSACLRLQPLRSNHLSHAVFAGRSSNEDGADNSDNSGVQLRYEEEIWTKDDVESALRDADEAMTADRPQDAIKSFSSALDAAAKASDTRYHTALRERANAHIRAGMLKEAMDDALRCTELQPSRHESFEVLGSVHCAYAQYSEAVWAYNKALELHLKFVPESKRDELDQMELDHIIDMLSQVKVGFLESLPKISNFRLSVDATRWPLRTVWHNCHRSNLNIRQFGLLHDVDRIWPVGGHMPYLLTVPTGHIVHSASPAAEPRYPLFVYLHSAAGASICKGDLSARELGMVTEESFLSELIEGNRTGYVDAFISIAPCCPSNLQMIEGNLPKEQKKRKVYWFKSCDSNDYHNWDFSRATRCRSMELAVLDLIRHVCHELPVDPERIYLGGASAGGYATFRLAELLPRLFAAIIPCAGYYPKMQDHDPEEAVERIRQMAIWVYHCQEDKVCKPDMVHVQSIYNTLAQRLGVEVMWVDPSVASGKSYHSPHKAIFQDPSGFFERLLMQRRASSEDPVDYLEQRLSELWQSRS